MDIGKKIQILRKFRNMTQAELGIEIGYKPESASNRITQYETGYRVPKRDILWKLSVALDVSIFNFIDTEDPACDFIISLFWLDPLEESEPLVIPWLLHGQDNSENGISILPKWSALTTAFYDEHSEAPKPFIEFRDNSINTYLAEWNRMRVAMEQERITKEDYIDWKFNWFEGRPEPSDKIKYSLAEMFSN